MSKRKNIKKSTRHNILGIILSIIFAAFVVINIFRIYEFITNDNLSLNSDQVWCANCQTYHDRETAAQEEKEKLIWCINCQRYHAPDADESK